MKNKLKQIYSSEEIQKFVHNVAHDICWDFKDKNPVIIIILKGGMVFGSDLIRCFWKEFEYDLETITASSYKNETSSSGNVCLSFSCDLENIVKDRHVILVDDIAETFVTLNYIINNPLLQHAKKIYTCVLIEKSRGRIATKVPDYFGAEHLQDEFLVGYGMGYGEKYRGLSTICSLTFENSESDESKNIE